MKVSDNLFIWTEAFGCEEILIPFLLSYQHHNSVPLFILGRKNEIRNLMKEECINKSIIFFDDSIISDELEKKIMIEYSSNGHRATAILWTFLIKKMDQKFFLHLDSDIIFVGPVIDPLINTLNKGAFWISGIFRNQLLSIPALLTRFLVRYTDQNHTYVKTVDTRAVLFRRDILSWIPKFLLIRLIQSSRLYGIRFIFGDSARDFFDPIVLFLQIFQRVSFVSRDSEISNNIFNIGSAVGSGCSLYNRGFRLDDNISEYKKYAIHCYMIYSRLILRKSDFSQLKIDTELLKEVNRLDFLNWTLN